MKALFIFPPLWSNFSPNTGIPQIMGFLKQQEYINISAIDLNIKFFRYTYAAISKKIKNDKLSFIKNFKLNKLIVCLDNFFYQKGIKENKYSEREILKISKNINIINLIMTKLFSCNINLFYVHYFGLIADKIVKEEYDYIGFSVNHSKQFESVTILSKILRDKGYRGKICIGGSYVYYAKKHLKMNINLFENYVNFAIIGNGEIPTLQLFRYIEGKVKLTDVSNIIYLDKNKQFVENNIFDNNINEYVEPNYSGYDFTEYNAVDPVLPIRTSTGCYWGKCTFCNYDKISKYNQRTVDSVINEINFLINKYKINIFYIVDAALSPSFINEFADKILEKDLEIYYFTNLRFEDCYTPEFLGKLYKSGLRSVGWGLESASPRILKLMNKGIKIETAERILKNTSFWGIKNHLYYIHKFPSETENDFKLTYNFIKKNKKYISSVRGHEFYLDKNSYIYNHLEEFGLSLMKIEAIEQKRIDIPYFTADELELTNNNGYYKEFVETISKMFKNNYPTEIELTISKYKNSKVSCYSKFKE